MIGQPNPTAAATIAEVNRRRREGEVYYVPWNKGRTATFNCEVCGQVTERWLGRMNREGRKSRYCSRACADEAKRRVTGADHPLYTQVARTCEWCGAAFTAKPAVVKNGGARYCSRNCLGAAKSAMQGGRSSSIEDIVAAALTDVSVTYTRQARIGRWSVDFLLPGSLIVVECDGIYWHSLPDVVARDRRKDVDLSSRGFLVVRLDEREIRSNASNLARAVGIQDQERRAAAAGMNESRQFAVPA